MRFGTRWIDGVELSALSSASCGRCDVIASGAAFVDKSRPNEAATADTKLTGRIVQPGQSTVIMRAAVARAGAE